MKRTNWKKIFTIISHEYMMKVRSKGFILSTLLAPLGILAIIIIPVIVTAMSQDTTSKKVLIYDKTHKLAEAIADIDRGFFAVADVPEDSLKAQIIDEKIDAYLLIPDSIISDGKAVLYSRGGGGLAFFSKLEKSLENIVRKERLINAGVTLKAISIVEGGVSVETKKLSHQGEEKDSGVASVGVGYLMSFMIYMLVFIYGSMVSRGVIEEKANRIIEILASSAKPFEIMMGKVIGIGTVGLTQVLFWAIMMGALILFGVPFAQHTFVGISPEQLSAASMANNPNAWLMDIPNIPISLIFYFIFYFLAGYFLYATLFAAVGSAVDQESDAAQLQTPITLPLIIPMLFIGNIISNPDGTLSTVLSLIPFFSPILMILRIASSQVPTWQIVLSIALMIGTFFAAVWGASRIYRVGILMYGKKPVLKDIIKWIRLSR